MTLTKNTWEKLTQLLSKTLTENLNDGEETKSVLSAWEEQKKEVSTLLSKGTRKRKDPNAPKAPKSAYLFFCDEERARIRKENKDLSAKEVTIEMGKRWHAITPKNKEKFQKMADEAKKNYVQAKAEYSSSKEEVEEKGRSKKEKSGVKKPLNAFNFFCKQNRAKVASNNPQLLSKQVMATLGQMWNALSEKERLPYQKMADEDKQRYINEGGQQKKKEVKKEVKEAKTKGSKPKSKDVKKEKSKESGKRERLSKTAGYNCFADEKRSELETEHPDWSARKISTHVNKAWKELSQEDKDSYEKEANAENSESEEEVPDEPESEVSDDDEEESDGLAMPDDD